MEKRQEEEEKAGSECESRNQHHSSSKNELEEGDANEEDYIRCSRCDQQVVGQMFHCPNYCSYFVHNHCIDLPHTLPSHPLHPHAATLTLSLVAVDSDQYHHCFGCPKKFKTSFLGYECTHTGCSRKLDIKCALSFQHNTRLHCHTLEFYYVNHRQQACNRKGNEKVNILIEDVTGKHCTICELPLIGPVKGCESCNFWIHTGCQLSPGVTEITSIETQRDYQPRLHREDHILAHLSAPPFLNRCGACGTRVTRNTLHCKECNVDFHSGCATRKPTLKHGLIKNDIHNHDLTYFPDPAPLFCCYGCKGYSYKTPIYRCVECDFNLHKACIQFQTTVHNPTIHNCSLHLYEDFPLYMKPVCSVCQEAVDPNPGAYCCSPCNFFIHLHCFQLDTNKQEIQRRELGEVVPSEPLVGSTIVDTKKKHISQRIEELQSKIEDTFAKLNLEKKILMERWQLNQHAHY